MHKHRRWPWHQIVALGLALLAICCASAPLFAEPLEPSALKTAEPAESRGGLEELTDALTRTVTSWFTPPTSSSPAGVEEDGGILRAFEARVKTDVPASRSISWPPEIAHDPALYRQVWRLTNDAPRWKKVIEALQGQPLTPQPVGWGVDLVRNADNHWRLSVPSAGRPHEVYEALADRLVHAAREQQTKVFWINASGIYDPAGVVLYPLHDIIGLLELLSDRGQELVVDLGDREALTDAARRELAEILEPRNLRFVMPRPRIYHETRPFGQLIHYSRAGTRFEHVVGRLSEPDARAPQPLPQFILKITAQPTEVANPGYFYGSWISAGLEEGTPIPLAEALRTLKTDITASGVSAAQVGSPDGPIRSLTRLTEQEASVPLDDAALMAVLQEGTAGDNHVVLEHREDRPLLIRPPTAAELRWVGVTTTGLEEQGGTAPRVMPELLLPPSEGTDIQSVTLLFNLAKPRAYIAWIPKAAPTHAYFEVRGVEETGRGLLLQPVSADRLRTDNPQWVDAREVLRGTPRLVEAAGLEEDAAKARDVMIGKMTDAWTTAISDDPQQVLVTHEDVRSQPALVFKPGADANDLAVVAIRQGYRVAIQLDDNDDPDPLHNLLSIIPTPHGAYVVAVGWLDVSEALDTRGWNNWFEIRTRAEALDTLDLPTEDDQTQWLSLGPLATALQRTRDYLAAQAGLESGA